MGDRKNTPSMGIKPVTSQSLDFMTAYVIPARDLDDITVGTSVCEVSVTSLLPINYRAPLVHLRIFTIQCVLGLGINQYLGVFGGDLKNTSTVEIEPVTSR
ncbi:hypothetical protein DPMN_076935 [Dreissena polymorpha]|uniref:Uncharacterized protein n=1 Tax=Dreissena polymorpha TaxID=45954 RepID=A0A9D3YJZ4_DREPO|nr:hypothetical protein DPMN_076935 [Dreissena polymorpha]